MYIIGRGRSLCNSPPLSKAWTLVFLSPFFRYDKKKNLQQPTLGIVYLERGEESEGKVDCLFLPSLPLAWVTLARSEQLTRV